LGADQDDPVVWASAVGANVEDVDGNRFVDLMAGFGVAFVGHRHPAVVDAATKQTHTLIHAMGDAWPDRSRIELLGLLASVAPGDLSVSILGLSGSDAVDGAVKTAVLKTGRSGVLTFDGGYHGLATGVLPLQGYKSAFSKPFAGLLRDAGPRLPFGCPITDVEAALAGGDVGLILVEPVQGRGGMRPAPDGWLGDLRDVAHRHGALLCFDEIQSGMGRTGYWFASEYDKVVPDLMCVGKALAGGFPLSACIGTPEAMNGWAASTGEALHTQTFLGHPVGCAAALATIKTMQDEDLVSVAKQRGEVLRAALQSTGVSVRGRGLMLGIELGDASFAVSRALLRRGWICLPAGMHGEVIGITPPVCLTDTQIESLSVALTEAMVEVRNA
jgi:4-aminobutyrate aminotransferase-like enzyme